MKAFIIKALLYILIILILGSLIIFICIQTMPNKVIGNVNEYFMWEFQKNKINQQYSEHKNIIIGDSRALAALNPIDIQHNFLNFSLGGSTMFEGYITLKKFIAQNNLDTLIICYSPIHFNGSDEAFEKRTLSFDFISNEDLKSLEQVEKKLGITIDKKLPSAYLNFVRKLHNIRFPTLYRATFIYGLNYNADNTPRISKQMNETNGHCLFGLSDSSNGISEENNFVLDKNKFLSNTIILSYLDSIYSVCSKKNIKMYFIVPPLNQSTYKKIGGSRYYHEFLELLAKIKHQYPDINYLEDFQYLPNKYFGDHSHLNASGSRFISNYIKAKLENTYYTNIN